MHKRFIALAVIVLLVGLVTNAFAQNAPSANSGANSATISRAGAVALLVESDPALKSRLQYFMKYAPPLPLFDDMDYAQWYAPYIETAFEAGLITGNDERLFRPGALLTEEEGIAISARYYAMKNPAIMAEMQSARHENWFNGVVSASVQQNLTLPFPIRLGQPMSKVALFALMSSMNIQNPQQIAISYQPTPTPPIVVAAAVTNNPQPTRVPISAIINRPAQQAPAAVYRPPVAQVAQVTAPAPVVSAPAASAKAFAISMPTLGVKDLTITHPTDPFTKDGLHAPLKYGVGHLFSYPGKGGKILVYGHSSSYPWDVSNFTKIFRQINKLAVGDLIYVTYGGKVHTYKVSKKQTVPASDMSVYQQAGGEELILYTCWPPDSIKERYLVHALPVESVAANR